MEERSGGVEGVGSQVGVDLLEVEEGGATGEE